MKRVLENIIKRAFCELKKIFQDEVSWNFIATVNDIVRFFLSHNWIQRIKLKEIKVQNILIWLRFGIFA